MNILVAHNYYHISGGADRVAWESAALFEEKGHSIIPFSMTHLKNWSSEYAPYFVDEIDYSRVKASLNNLKTALRMIYSIEARKKMEELIQDTKPDVAHLHNIYGRLTPSILQALKRYAVPVVMTLHDYKLVCPSYTLFNKGRTCEICQGYKFYRAAKSRCHKDSYLVSLTSCIEAYVHRWMGMYERNVDFFIAPSQFLKEKMINFGLPSDKFVHIPNFINTETYSPEFGNSRYLLYFGRLSREKGILTLLEAMRKLPDTPLYLAGDGSLKAELQQYAERHNLTNVKFLGHLDQERLMETIRQALFVIVPSECYENFPMSVLEAFSLGKPVIGSNLGGITEIIDDNSNGLLFVTGDPADLSRRITYLMNDPDKIKQMGVKARKKTEDRYNSELYYTRVMSLYTKAIQ